MRERVIKVISTVLERPVSQSEENKKFVEYVDSLMFIRMLIDIEAEFNISIDEDDINYETLSSIDDVVKYIESHS